MQIYSVFFILRFLVQSIVAFVVIVFELITKKKSTSMEYKGLSGQPHYHFIDSSLFHQSFDKICSASCIIK